MLKLIRRALLPHYKEITPMHVYRQTVILTKGQGQDPAFLILPFYCVAADAGVANHILTEFISENCALYEMQLLASKDFEDQHPRIFEH